MQADVVIGANYGDEGKGLITDYLAAKNNTSTLVIRFNGGAQAGHTVQTPNGLRHVFSHVGSGVFAGAATYLSECFIANPILFTQELKILHSLGFFPKIMIHPQAIVTTPYDMYLNQLIENDRDENRHGSCGVGIGETMERNLYTAFQLTVNDLYDQVALREKIVNIRDEWVSFRVEQLLERSLTVEERQWIYGDAIFEYFLNDLEEFANTVTVVDYSHFKQWNKFIFEGAQGLLLDQHHKNFPHVTRSNTGIENVSRIASLTGINHLNIHYVTRCYVTRHGAGPLPDECEICPVPFFNDETNIPHKFQGSLRFAPLNITTMNAEIANDLKKLSPSITTNITLAVTCLDQFDASIPVINEIGQPIEIRKNIFLHYMLNHSQFDNYLLSYGPTREHCKSVLQTKCFEYAES